MHFPLAALYSVELGSHLFVGGEAEFLLQAERRVHRGLEFSLTNQQRLRRRRRRCHLDMSSVRDRD